MKDETLYQLALADLLEASLNCAYKSASALWQWSKAKDGITPGVNNVSIHGLRLVVMSILISIWLQILIINSS